MAKLSISKAWDETKAIVGREGGLFVSVALALVALPAAVAGVLSPNGLTAQDVPGWAQIVLILVSLIALAGQLALIRLALGPSITVGSAIGHGIRRMPFYCLSAIILILGFMILAMPFALALRAMGVPMDRSVPPTPPLILAGLLYLALLCFFGVRMLMATAVASAEDTGPIEIIRRSWTLTDGHWWKLFAFLLCFFVVLIVASLGAGAAFGTLIRISLGPIEPMSLSALVVALISAAINTAVTIFFAVMIARIYVQLSGRGEAEVSVPTTGI